MEKQVRIIVAGGRDFTDNQRLTNTLDYLTSRCLTSELEIVCGEAKGADSLGKQWALSKGIKVKSFPADWKTFGKRAGYLRNQQMAEYATHCVCFWDGKSRGTAHMIKLAKEKQLDTRVRLY